MLVGATVYTHRKLEPICAARQARIDQGADPRHLRIVGTERPRLDLTRFLDDGAVDIGCEARSREGAGTVLAPSNHAWIALHYYLFGLKYGGIVFVILFAFNILPLAVWHWWHNRGNRP